jgi:biopolymer transport protein ExbD
LELLYNLPGPPVTARWKEESSMPHITTRPNGFASRSRSAMGEMNVTPFIDVLLVLLIMLILAVPMPVHETRVDLPGEPKCEGCLINRDQNSVVITASDALLWNGTPVTRAQLRMQVAAASALPQEPVLRFEPDALASYDTAARTITLIKDAGATSFAFTNHHHYRQF